MYQTGKYGMRCWGCDEDIEVDDGPNANIRCEALAASRGWGFGLQLSGQALFTCPGCAPCLFAVKPIIPFSLPAEESE